MRKFIVIVFLVASFFSRAQYNTGIRAASIQATKSFVLPPYPDTASANLFHVNDSCGAVIRTADNKIWKRSCSPLKWEEIGAAAGSGVGSASPGGSSGNVQVNSGGSFGGTSNLNWNGNQFDINGTSNPGLRVYYNGTRGWYLPYNVNGDVRFYNIDLGRDVMSWTYAGGINIPLATVPLSSAGAYDVLTWNTTTGNMERVLASSLIGSGGTASPAGSNSYIQYNSGGSFGASANFIYNGNQIVVNGTSNPGFQVGYNGSRYWYVPYNYNGDIRYYNVDLGRDVMSLTYAGGINLPLATVPLSTAGNYDVLTWSTVSGNMERVPVSTFAGSGSAQVQSDWTQTNASAVDYIKNKQYIPESNNSAVSASAVSSDMGSGATFAAYGNATAGSVEINSATVVGSGIKTLAHVTFSSPYSSAPASVQLTPANGSLAITNNTSRNYWVANVTASGFDVQATFAGSGDGSNTFFQFYFRVN